MKDTNLIIGKKNTGKTQNILFNELLKSIDNNENLCIFNTRDEYFRTFSKKLKENNYNVLTLNLSDTTKSNGYNPLQLPYLLYKEGKLDLAVSMINTLALEIFKDERNNADPFWENMASNYFTGLVLILFNEGSESEINLGSIQVMMSQGEEQFDKITYLKKYLDNIEVTSVIYSLLSPVAFAPAETKGSIIAVSKQKLNLYMLREQLLNLLNTNEINIKELTNKTAIFIIGNNSINSIGNILINQLIEASNLPFTYILDNFDELKKLMCFDNLIKNASYNNNKVYISVHNEDELKEKYGQYVIDNFDNVVYSSNIELNNKINLGEDNDYPNLLVTKKCYIDFKNLINNKFN